MTAILLLGTSLLVAGVAAALIACLSLGLVAAGQGGRLLRRVGASSVYGTLVAVSASSRTLLALFISRQFIIAYVFDYSSRDLPLFFTISATWAGQAGSFLLWTFRSAVVATLVLRRALASAPLVLVVLLLIIASLLTLTLLVNPFQPLPDLTPATLPADGSGLSPLLQNLWMAIHPPILFIAYALTAVPFASALSALLRREYDRWLVDAQPWALAAWTFLGLALLLGGYWAYETQGWGGYWGWDPVENSALVPWLLLTALLHSMHVQRTRRGLRRTTLTLALLSYLTVLYASFLARGGALANFSVHSFVLQGLTTPLAMLVLTAAAASLALLSLRWRKVPRQPLSDELFSRDSFIVLSVLALALIAVVVKAGTSMPLISAIPGLGFMLQNLLGPALALDDGSRLNNLPFADGRFSLGVDFYTTTVPPLGLVVVALVSVAPLLGGRTVNWSHLLWASRWPACAAALMVGVVLTWGVRDSLPLAYIALATFAAGTNVVMVVRTLRGGWLRLGGYLAHVGVCVLLLGVVGSTVYASDEVQIALYRGDRVSLFGTTIGFDGWRQTSQSSGVLDLRVQRGGMVAQLPMTYYYYAPANAIMKAPAVKSYPLEDLYIVAADYAPAIDPNQPTLLQDDATIVGPYTITFSGLDASLNNAARAEIGATLRVDYEGQTYTVRPRASFEEDGTLAASGRSVNMPGGHKLTLTHLDVERRLVDVQIDGLALPVEKPERVVLRVSIKPLIQLVWLGLWLTMAGGLVATLRRTLEAWPRPQFGLRGRAVRNGATVRHERTGGSDVRWP